METNNAQDREALLDDALAGGTKIATLTADEQLVAYGFFLGLRTGTNIIAQGSRRLVDEEAS